MGRMSRELRRVPPTWEHPRDKQGKFRPLYDRTFESAAREWKRGFAAWEADEDGMRSQATARHGPVEYWEWEGYPPDREYYRPEWTVEEASAYQIYETVTEGTPISPVISSEKKVVAWLIDELHLTRRQAEEFIRVGSVPSAMVSMGEGGVSVRMNFETLGEE